MERKEAHSTKERAETSSLVHRKRSTRGRASRRRRKKLRDIQQAAEAIGQGRVAPPNSASTLPTDRSKEWPAVYERRTFHKWSVADERALVGQLGYLPGNAINISTRASSVSWLKTKSSEEQQEPVVVQLYPMVVRDEHAGGKSGGRKYKSRKRRQIEQEKDTCQAGDSDRSLIEPFPTIYWLTHPILRVLVSKLELESFGVRLEKRLAAEPDSLASMKRAHHAYGKARQQLLTESDRALVRERKWDSAFVETRGVAGIRNHAAIKCLHAHVAHALSGGSGSSDNVVGSWVLQAVQGILSTGDKHDETTFKTPLSRVASKKASVPSITTVKPNSPL